MYMLYFERWNQFTENLHEITYGKIIFIENILRNRYSGNISQKWNYGYF